jgi:signal transduction histidine kinase
VRWYGCNTDIEDRKLAEKALPASEQLARGQVNALKSALDTLAKEPDPGLLVAHIMRTITEQFGADSASVWRPDSFDERLTLDFVFEDGRIVPSTDLRFAGLDLALPMGERWPWPGPLRLARPSAIADIRTLPAFPLRDRLLPLGIVTVLLVPMTVAGRLEGAIGLRFRARRDFETESLGLAQALANQAMLMIKLAELSAQGREAAVVGERNRIARDIHDTLAQGFTGIIVQLEAAEDATRRSLGHEAEQHVVTARNLARESLREARRSVRALRPQPLEECQLTTAVQALFARLPEGAALRATFKVQGPTWPLPPEWEENLFRITQEVLTNVLRHAHATHLAGKITFHAQGVLVEFVDDGQGFDPAAISEGYGLLGMRERVDAMGGQMQIRSTKGRGTTLSIRLPAAPPEASEPTA